MLRQSQRLTICWVSGEVRGTELLRAQESKEIGLSLRLNPPRRSGMAQRRLEIAFQKLRPGELPQGPGAGGDSHERLQLGAAARTDFASAEGGCAYRTL
jgi:hypothetical protein